jgi:flagellar basal body-associated protein FliL
MRPVPGRWIVIAILIVVVVVVAIAAYALFFGWLKSPRVP